MSYPLELHKPSRTWIKMHKFVFRLLIVVSALTATLVNGQYDQAGFISIDCGIADGFYYTDPITSIQYTSDARFVDSGVSKNISAQYQNDSLEKQFLNLRSFPQGTRNCYTLRPSQGKGNKYLIRTSFMYGNYDSMSKLPTFDLYLGADLWDTVKFETEYTPVRKEIIHIASSDYINVCLLKTELTTPFISILELRLLDSIMYETENQTLQLVARMNFAPVSERLIRYKDDTYDRIWTTSTPANTTTLSTQYTIFYSDDYFKPPSAVMRTAVIPENANDSVSFYWESHNLTDVFHMYLHFAEIQKLSANQLRGFSIFVNGELWHYNESHMRYLYPFTIFTDKQFPLTGHSKYVLTLSKTAKSTLPPIISAVEVYSLKEFSLLVTDDKDVSALLSIKSIYGLLRNWQGDPCFPMILIWDGLSCAYVGFKSPRVTSLNLSSSGLNGIIAPQIANLTMLEVLDLSHNNLTGNVPEFLAELDSLKVLNLKGNNFSGPIPDELLKKSTLSLSIDDRSNRTDMSQTPKRINRKVPVLVPVLASLLGSVFALLILLVTVWRIQHSRVIGKLGGVVPNLNTSNETALEVKNRQFTYAEVLKITNNFQKVIGKGGFGTVYHGFLGDIQVAVKILSSSSSQGYKQFLAEAKLLLSVYHRNLTSFLGYCNETDVMGIVYEYMANGNLEQNLSHRNPYVLRWENRLQIATDAAQGLEYLHNGCKPPIVHRDVKPTNILLDGSFQAKLADFGLSKAFLSDDHSHVSTRVAGTPGYLDPEYHSTSQFSEKSDIYSFGVVLLVIVTGRPAVAKNNEKTHIIQWIREMLPTGDIHSIVDPRLQGEFAATSAWKVVELAMACISRNSTRRPNMTDVVAELKECLAIEMPDQENQSDNVRMIPMSLGSEFGPRAL